MNPKRLLLPGAAVCSLFLNVISAPAQGTTFTYQGRLNDGGVPATGNYDLTFALFSANIGGSQVGNTLTNAGVNITNGLFTVTLDFSNSLIRVFNGTPYWLQIGVRTNGAGVFTPLSLRQELTPTPYAIYGENAGTANLANTIANATVSVPQLLTVGTAGTGQVLGFNGTNLFWENPVTAAFAWNLAGNAGSSPATNFLGTLDNQPLEMRVSGGRALRLEPNTNGAPNVVGGSPNNFVSPGIVGAFIGGGGALSYLGSSSTNSVSSGFGTISGGWRNTIQANSPSSTIGGGYFNAIQTNASASTIAGGYQNTIQTAFSTIAGGVGSTIGANAVYSTIGGGEVNTIQTNAALSVISGGSFNTIQTNAGYSTIAGGNGGTIGVSAGYSTIAGGSGGTIGVGAGYSAIGGGQGNYIADGDDHSFIGGGLDNTLLQSANYSMIGGGSQNSIFAPASTIGGGTFNDVSDAFNFGGGTVGGGIQNTNTGSYATIAGGHGNFAGGYLSSVGGGEQNKAGYASTVSGGYRNNASGSYATIPGGANNTASGNYSFAAGQNAWATYDGTFVWSDTSSLFYDFVSTGSNQFLIRATGGVGIGWNNPQAQLHVSSPGGNSMPQAQLDQTPPSDFSRLRFTVNQNFSQRWDIGANATEFVIYSGTIGASMIQLNSSGLTVNGAFVSSSDRNAKEHFETVNSAEILAKVTALPIAKWNFKQDPGTKHLGPVAQDFYAAFNVGSDDKHIATVDEGGVALAAIQGLNQKLEDTLRAKDAEIEQLKRSVAELREVVGQLTKAASK